MIHGVLPFSEALCLQARYFLSVDARRALSVPKIRFYNNSDEVRRERVQKQLGAQRHRNEM
jgi:hypothetical protein